MKHKTRFTDEEVQSSTIMMYGSKSTYNYARKNKLMHLPSEKTVRKRTGHFLCAPGYQEDILNLLSKCKHSGFSFLSHKITRSCAPKEPILDLYVRVFFTTINSYVSNQIGQPIET